MTTATAGTTETLTWSFETGSHHDRESLIDLIEEGDQVTVVSHSDDGERHVTTGHATVRGGMAYVEGVRLDARNITIIVADVTIPEQPEWATTCKLVRDVHGDAWGLTNGKWHAFHSSNIVLLPSTIEKTVGPCTPWLLNDNTNVLPYEDIEFAYPLP